MRRYWRRRFAVLAATVSTILVVSAVEAAAGPPEIDGGDAADDTREVVDVVEALGLTKKDILLLRRQAALDRVAVSIEEAASEDAADGSGLSGLVVDPGRNELQVYWHGRVFEPVQRHIRQARREGIRVTVESAPYTLNELLAEIDRMTSQPLFDGERVGQRTMAAVPAYDGSGIDVTLSGIAEPMTVALAKQTVPALDSDYPLSISFDSGIDLSYRWFDVPRTGAAP